MSGRGNVTGFMWQCNALRAMPRRKYGTTLGTPAGQRGTRESGEKQSVLGFDKSPNRIGTAQPGGSTATWDMMNLRLE